MLAGDAEGCQAGSHLFALFLPEAVEGLGEEVVADAEDAQGAFEPLDEGAAMAAHAVEGGRNAHDLRVQGGGAVEFDARRRPRRIPT